MAEGVARITDPVHAAYAKQAQFTVTEFVEQLLPLGNDGQIQKLSEEKSDEYE